MAVLDAAGELDREARRDRKGARTDADRGAHVHRHEDQRGVRPSLAAH